ESPSPPVGIHRRPQSGVRFLHLFARFGLSQNPDPAATQLQDLTPGIRQGNPCTIRFARRRDGPRLPPVVAMSEAQISASMMVTWRRLP
ncbi:MAG: hypothetical protein ABI836_03330, partial [Gemmatimonadota bacterium]